MNVYECSGKNIFMSWKMESSIPQGISRVEWNFPYWKLSISAILNFGVIACFWRKLYVPHMTILHGDLYQVIPGDFGRVCGTIWRWPLIYFLVPMTVTIVTNLGWYLRQFKIVRIYLKHASMQCILDPKVLYSFFSTH